MSKKITGIIWIVSLILIGYFYKLFVVSDFFIGLLESNRISIYYFNDCILLLFAIVLLWRLVIVFVLKKQMNDNSFDFSSYFLCVMLIFRFFATYYYPNVPRSEIGLFYKIPEGQTITYPKYPKDTKK